MALLAAWSAFAIVMCLLNAPVIAIGPAAFLIVLVLLIRAQTPAIRRLENMRRTTPITRRGVFIQPEIGLPPGFVLPSARLTPPESVPPLTSMPPTARESQQMAECVVEFCHDRAVAQRCCGNHYAAVRMFGALTGRCAHPRAVPVDLLVTGERVAWLCTDLECGTQLPLEWPAESGAGGRAMLAESLGIILGMRP